MSSGEHRRSPRIVSLQTDSQSKGRDRCKLPRKKDIDAVQDSSISRSREKAKIKPVQDLVLNKVENQVQKADTQCYYDHINAVTTLSRTPLPEKGKLEILLRALQRRDSNKFFAQPVDPKKVKYYDEVIKEPMDFGTIAKKLNEGRYEMLEEFEKDVFLISRNATFFNGPKTVYYIKGLAIEELAKELFDVLKTDPENFEAKFSKKRILGGVEFLNSKPCNKRTNTETLEAPRDERTFEYYKLEQDKRSSYSLCKESVVSAVDSQSKTLYLDHENGIGYVRSIMLFAKDLGPTAQKVAIQMARRCKPEDFKIKNTASSCQFLAPTSHIPALFFAKSGQKIVPPSNSENFTGSVGQMHGDTLNRELIFAGSTMSRYHASVGGIANASGEKRETPNAFCQKNVQTGFGCSKTGNHASVGGIANASGEKRETPNAFCQKNVQTGFGCSKTGTGFENDVVNQNDGFGFRNFPIDYSQVGSSTLFTARKSSSIPSKFVFSNMKQVAVNEDKQVQTAEVAFSKATMKEFFPTINFGASSYSEVCSSNATPGLNGREAFSSMHGAGSQYLGSEMPHIQAATDGGFLGFRSHLEPEGQVVNWFKPPVQRLQYVQALTSGGGQSYGGNLNQGRRLSNCFDMPIAEPMLSHGLTDGEVPVTNGGNLERGGQGWNQFKPTVLGTPQIQTIASQEGESSRGDFQQRGQANNCFNMPNRNLNWFKR